MWRIILFFMFVVGAGLTVNEAKASCDNLVSSEFWMNAPNDKIIHNIKNCHDPMIRDNEGNSPLHYATGIRYAKELELLNGKKQFLLFKKKFAEARDDIIFDELIKKNFGINARNIDGSTPLYYFIMAKGSLKTVQAFINHGAKMPMNVSTFNLPDNCEHSLKVKVNPFLKIALKADSFEVFRYLLSLEHTIQNQAITCQVLTFGKDTRLLDLLDEKNILIEEYDQGISGSFNKTSFQLAASNNSTAGNIFLKRLLDTKKPSTIEQISSTCAHSNKFITPLHEAAWHLDDKKISILLDYGFKSNVQDCQGMTAFDVYKKQIQKEGKPKSETFWRLHDQSFD